ncbi:complex I subunit 5 family protein [Ornithinimicrobium sufpigmenti]|uniref:complex I subunit 5 family protein n=1 Tax=Ornithinimicrobium sufpigmenti TaxID=2508882 RepID=UPI0010358014|nr:MULTISPECIES: proton-conducting transporter membrane subunit [unclassified Ornithinimicrobium]
MTHLLGIPLHLLPLVLLGLSLLAGVIIFLLPERAKVARTTVNLTAAIAKVVLLALLLPVVLEEDLPAWRSPLLPGVELVLRIDTLSLVFASLSAVLWLVTTVYAIGYLEGRPNRSRFFGFFSLCVTATVGISFAGNLVTFLLFYEMLTLVTYPLVAHYGTVAALKAARLYLIYALTGGLVLLVGIVWLTAMVGPVEFRAGGVPAVAALAEADPVAATWIFVLLIGGLGVKAALVPLHGWLPRAMVAPAPVSALLHAVAVVKAGAFGIARVLEDVYGPRVAEDLGVLLPLLVLACGTVVYGSVRALAQDDLKARLAYSTVSQVSYVTLGLALATSAGITGGIVHLVHQGLMKITLFFCAGLFAEALGVTKVSQLAGMARRMPVSATAFTVAGLGMMGIPPVAGFVSKWYLGLGALEADQPWVVAVLLSSALLNALYFLPVIYVMWFREPGEPVLAGQGHHGRGEAPLTLLVPAVTTASLALAAGLLAAAPFSPLAAAQVIAERVVTR